MRLHSIYAAVGGALDTLYVGTKPPIVPNDTAITKERADLQLLQVRQVPESIVGYVSDHCQYYAAFGGQFECSA